METVNQLLADINMGSTATQAVKTMFRVQKSNKHAPTTGQPSVPSSDPKPLVVVFRNTHYKEKLFRNVKALKGNARWASIVIKPDKTKLH